MAKENEEQDKADGKTTKAISKEKLTALVRRVNNLANEAQTASGKIGEAVADHVEKHHLHRKAFSIIRQMVKMGKDNPAKLQEFLFNLDLYREHLEIDKMLPDDMLPDRKKGGKKGQAEAAPKGNGRLRAVEGGLQPVGDAARRVTEGAQA